MGLVVEGGLAQGGTAVVGLVAIGGCVGSGGGHCGVDAVGLVAGGNVARVVGRGGAVGGRVGCVG